MGRKKLCIDETPTEEFINKIVTTYQKTDVLMVTAELIS